MNFVGGYYTCRNFKMNSDLLQYIQNDDLTSLKRYISGVDNSILESQDDLNIYQIACILGSTKILRYLDNNGLGFLGKELDAVPFLAFISL